MTSQTHPATILAPVPADCPRSGSQRISPPAKSSSAPPPKETQKVPPTWGSRIPTRGVTPLAPVTFRAVQKRPDYRRGAVRGDGV